MAATTNIPSSLVLTEALGFSPQLLLDDIINVGNNAVQDGINGTEEFLLKWVEESEPNQEIEQGLVSFQTLLEYHTDIAFDFFEAWSLRNIFLVPPELDEFIVLPHHEGLHFRRDGDGKKIVERERELMEEMEVLRKRLDDQRRLSRLLTRAIHTSKRSYARAQSRYQYIASLFPPPLDSDSGSQSLSPLENLCTLPDSLINLYTTVSTLPPLDPSLLLKAKDGHMDRAGNSAYVEWAVGRLVDQKRGTGADDVDAGQERTKGEGNVDEKMVKMKGEGVVDQLEEAAAYLGSARDVREAVGVLDVRIARGNVNSVQNDLRTTQ